MSRAGSLDINGIALSVAGAVAGALAAYLGLSVLARPAHVSTRLAEITRRADDAERMSKRLRGGSSYPIGAVCDGGGDAGAATFKQKTVALANQSAVNLIDFQAQPQMPDEANGGLQPVRIALDGAGSSGAIDRLLQALSKSTPSIFVDTLDLRPADGLVTLKLLGRMFCSAARP